MGVLRTPRYPTAGRVGVIVPSANTCSEPDLAALAPDGVACYTTRLPLRSSSVEDVRGMTDDVEAATALLRDVAPSLVLFHCTGASAIAGEGLVERMEETAGCPAATTADGIVAALRETGTERIALVGPYSEDIAAGEGAFFEAKGLDVTSNVALDLPLSDWSTLEPTYWLQAGRRAMIHGCDALVISCTNVRSIEVIEPLESELGVPVVTSNQAAMWYVLRLLAIEEPVRGYGALLARTQLARRV